MRNIFYFTAITSIGLIACYPEIDFNKMVPSHVNKYAIGFISEVKKGNIDSCLTLVSPEMNNEEGRRFLTNTYSNIELFTLDSICIINAAKTSMLGNKGFTNYSINYEYKVDDKFLYFTIGIREEEDNLLITSFDGTITDKSLSDFYKFRLKNKDFLHYLFLFFALIIPIFIIITLIYAFKTKLKLKWLWILGILIGFVKLSINWTTGQIGFNLFSFLILGSGFQKASNVAPWTISIAIPFIALFFWNKRYWILREAKAQKRLDERMKAEQDKNK